MAETSTLDFAFLKPKHLKIICITAIFLSFFVFLLMQHRLIFLMHDDYGLAVLDYVNTQTGFKGQDFSLQQALNFLAALYESWTGRILPIFLNIYAQKAGLEFIRIIQSLAIVMSAFLTLEISRIAVPLRPRIYLALFPVLLFLSLPVIPLIVGVYWFNAASVYVWGMPFFLLATYLTLIQKKLSVPAVLLISFAAAFHEQMAVSAIVYVTLFIWLFEANNIKRWVPVALKTVPLLLVSVAVIFAPGNFARMNSASSVMHYSKGTFVEILVNNSSEIAKFIFWPTKFNVFIWFMIFGLAMLLQISYKQARTYSRDRFFILIFTIAAMVSFALIMCFVNEKVVLFGAGFILFFTLALFNVSIHQKSGLVIFSVHMAALATLMPLLIAPIVTPRSVLPFLFLEFIPIIYAAAIADFPLKRIVHILVIASLGYFSVKNAALVYNGYRSNYEINKINDMQLRVASFLQNNHLADVKSIRLFKLRNRLFGVTMPYERPLINVWMKKFYRLDPDVELTWE